MPKTTGMSVEQCAQVLPRLTEIITRWKQHTPSDPALKEQIMTGEQLVNVLTICVNNRVRLIFG